MPISSGSQPATAKPRKTPSGVRPFRVGQIGAHTTQRRAPSENWLRVAGRDDAALDRRLDAGDAFVSRAGADAFVSAERDLTVAASGVLVGHLHGRGDRRDLVLEPAGLRAPAACAAAADAVLVLRLARDAVALRDGARRSAAWASRSPACARRARDRPACACSSRSARTRWSPRRRRQDLALAGDDALRGERDRLQTRGAEAVDRHAAVVTGRPARSAIWRAMLRRWRLRDWRSP